MLIVILLLAAILVTLLGAWADVSLWLRFAGHVGYLALTALPFAAVFVAGGTLFFLWLFGSLKRWAGR